MSILEHHKLAVDTGHFTFLNPVPPFVEICLKPANISAQEFKKIARLTAGYPNDARLVEMVRKAGDASAKVPYLLEAHQTPASILATLREVAGPHVERLRRMPEPLRSTIHLLLSINAVPRGCEEYAIAALLEIEKMQEGMIAALRGLMSGRQLARDFYQDNVAALHRLDRDWPRLRSEKGSQWHNYPLPEQPKMEYHPLFDAHDRLVSLRESCVIVDAPGAQMLKSLTPAVLQRPLPEAEPVPETGSADWLIRDVGKIGRHFTRALLSIIKAHLQEEKVALEAANYERIAQEAREALQEFVKKTS
jgi:hypothetical protein